jgi:hypothetical protein
MKKLMCLFAIIVLSNCEVKVKEANANSGPYLMYSEIIEGMEYRLFRMHSNGADNVFVINITKDKMEVEKLKRELPKKP